MPKGKKTKGKKESPSLIDYAVSQGIGELIKFNPIFKGYEQTIVRYIDNSKIQEKLTYLFTSKKINPAKITKGQANYISKELSEYVASGEVLNEKGQEIVFGKGLEEKVSKGFFGKVESFLKGKPNNKGIKYLSAAINATDDLKDIFSKNNYYKKMPEIAEAVSALDDLRALYPAARVLKAHNWISDSQYKNLTSKAYKIAEEAPKKITQGIVRNLDESYQKVAASILGAVGALLILLNVKMTGNVIGTSGIAPNLAGIILIIASLTLFVFKFKRKNKKKL